MEPLWAVLIGALFSGIAGIAATIGYQHWSEGRRLRIDCLRSLSRHPVSEPEFLQAFNEIPVVFWKSPKVLAAHLKVIESGNLVGAEMAELVCAVAKNLSIVGPTEKQLLSRFHTQASARA